jgi:hypothetical protein
LLKKIDGIKNMSYFMIGLIVLLFKNVHSQLFICLSILDDFMKNCGKSVDDKFFSQEIPPTKMTTQPEGLHSCSNSKES